MTRIYASLALFASVSVAGCGSAPPAKEPAPPPPAASAAAAKPAAPEPPPAPDPETANVPLRKKGENLFAGAKLYVDVDHRVRKMADAMKATKPAEASALDKIASQPAVEWLGGWNANIEHMGKARTAKINEAGALATYVVYNIPNRDCGQYSKGGVSGPDEYKRWIRALAKGIGPRRAAIILEPDALGLLTKCLSAGDKEARLAMLRDAVQVLEANGNTAVYIDAGNPHWMPAKDMAERLKSAGVDQADGFALNVSNYMTTAENVKYGKEISRLVGGKHFVIDTSRNGNGATKDFEWCNPHGRALGHKPTVDTGESLVDAFLWVKRPGESDGECNGGPKAGEFWLGMAVELANNTKD